jgi:hypothetical protein
MAFFAVLGGLYGLILLFKASRTYGSFSKIPNEEITSISARFGIFIGLALAIQSVLILVDALAGTASGWFLGGIATKGILVGVLGIFLLVKCLRIVKR